MAVGLAALPPVEESGWSFMDILLVDDDKAFLKILGRCLSERGHRLRMAADGMEALRCMDEEHPDLIISDICMPGMGGVELLKEVQEQFPGTPVVLVTGQGGVGDSAAAFQHGAYGYLQKPIQVEALLAGINRLEKAEGG